MGGRALLVEENEDIANALVPLLHKVGIEVEWVADAASAAGRLEVPSGLDAAIVESAVSSDRGLDLIERAKAAGLCAVLLLSDGEQAPAGTRDVAIDFPINAASLYAALGDVADADVAPAKILTPPSNDTAPTWSVPEGESNAADAANAANANGTAAAPSAPVATAAIPEATPSPPESTGSEPAASEPVVDDDTDPRLVAAAADRVEKGRKALADGRLELAIIELDSAAALHPQSKVAKGLGAWVRYVRVRDVAKTVGQAHRNIVAAAEATGDAGLWEAAAELAADLGFTELAKKRAQKALDIDPTATRATEIVNGA